MKHDEILQAAKEAGYGTAFYSIDGEPAHEEIWGGPMETQKVRSLIKIIEKRTIERCEDEYSMCLQSDLEHGIKYLNEKAADDFKKKYPALYGYQEAIRKLGEQ